LRLRRHRIAAAWLMAIAPSAASAEESRLDSFIGTLSIERGDVIFTRCDLGNSRYVLRDAAGAQAVARYRAYGKPAYADVMASYSEEGSRNVLTVVGAAGISTREFDARVRPRTFGIQLEYR
jgi:hypothetical protein